MRRPQELIVARSREGLAETLAHFGGRRRMLAVDTETSGLNWRVDRVGAINLACGTSALCAIGDALGPTARWLGDEMARERPLVFHNAKFDLHFLRETFGLHVGYPVDDTAVESFVVDNRGANAFGFVTKRAHSLKPLAQLYVDETAPDFEKALLKAIKQRAGRRATKGDWSVLVGTEDEKLFTDYSALDAWYTLELHRQFTARIMNWVQPGDEYPPLFAVYERERWLLLALRDMEERGIHADRDFLVQWRDEIKLKLDAQEVELRRLTRSRKLARDINWQSTPQVERLMYTARSAGGLGLNGHGTDAVTLLSVKHPFGAAMVQYRETYKQYSSYAKSLLEALTEQELIHCTIRSTGAGTGRTSCADPNLQQQTRISGVRKAYRPREKDLVFRMPDYSQIEMRFAAHFTGEPSLIDGFINDPDFDVHGSAARRMFGKAFDPDSQHRKYAKIVNFTKLFGGGLKKVTEQLINLMSEKEARAGCRAMSASIGIGQTAFDALASAIIDRFERTMPKMTRAIRQEANSAEQRGYMMNAFGGHRFFDFGDDRWYAAFNTRVQGTAGIKAKEGLVNVYRECQVNRGELALMLIIHDELIYESEGDPATDRRVLELMQDVTSYKVPIIADMSGSSTTWQAKEKIKL